MKLFFCAALLTFVVVFLASPLPDAPTGFDSQTNGVVDQTTHAADQITF